MENNVLMRRRKKILRNWKSYVFVKNWPFCKFFICLLKMANVSFEYPAVVIKILSIMQERMIMYIAN